MTRAHNISPVPLDLVPNTFAPTSTLGWATIFAFALMPVTLLLLAVDTRVLDGEALWLKPLKFQISMAILTGTLVLAVAASGLGHSLWMRGAPSITVAATAIYEMTFLGVQAGRGVRSHFNADTAFDRVGGMVRLVFVDEAGLSTRMARLLGRAPHGERCRAGIPHGH